ncbi:transposase [Algoriphagus halophytocola]|uniref:transposase n=1 Tax=Algoriphagus halophytocola TaxID=2991499 RepID=UPI0022DE92CD|nr:transposase [Algoriphagus sp. TR-M9]WBL43006.1 transposase [Algoriphagus sp. TR-M9]
MQQGHSYHIYNHANGSENIFREEENYRFFLRQYDKYLDGVVETYAYCLMPNYFHLLVGVKEFSDLPGFENLAGLERIPITKAFSNFFNSYTKAFNKKDQRRGSLFIKNFKRKPILTESQWQHAFLYIHLNPIKHGFAVDLEDWKWSSWKAYQAIEKESLLNRDYYLNFFDGLDHLNQTMESKKEDVMNKELE